jgi:radical SAM superfamily enzyme YgiQ (UPF0313 family)
MKAGPSDPGRDTVTSKSSRASARGDLGGILLVNVASPTRTGSPPLGMLYLAASAMEAGIPVELLDLSSPFGAQGKDALLRTVARLRPKVIGLALYTETALWAYELVRELGPDRHRLRVAGGPHATACPEEALTRGFDVVVRGEGEATLVALFQAVQRGTDLGMVEGIAYRDASGNPRKTAARALPLDLDRLPSPRRAAGLVDRSNYLRKGVREALPASLVTSRGCPGRCTFCSSNVSGRRYRFHSPMRVLSDMRDWNESEGATTFCFHDDAFTAHRRRLIELCSRMADLPFPARWICEARADHLDRERLKAMAGAGCTAVIVGIESGDPSVLERIGKGISLGVADRALRLIREAGMRTQVNFMLGFPGETAEELDHTLGFMQRIAPVTDGFSAMGIVTPYPNTRLYRQHHRSYGFTEWWLDEARMETLRATATKLARSEIKTAEDVVALHGKMEHALIDARLIDYPADVRAAIERCLAFRWRHNLQELERMRPGS